MQITRRIWLGATLLYMALVTYLSTLPGDEVAEWGLQGFITNLMHVPMYSVLAFFLLKTLGNFNKRSVSLAFILTVCYGIFNEFLQAQIPSRTFSIGDMMLNTLGAAITFLIYFLKINTNNNI